MFKQPTSNDYIINLLALAFWRLAFISIRRKEVSLCWVLDQEVTEIEDCFVDLMLRNGCKSL